ncbi:hypothetical protein GGS21DRAFT_501051 [Xylaria nigripes]|nr:hypothetical protein GGS21DRAFT_501051 [Xylaria nigripes]
MACANQELTHDEIWDDSALINSWDEALEEYKKYHSIHRNGGNVKELLKPKPEEVVNTEKSQDGIVESSNDEEVKIASATNKENLINMQEAADAETQQSQPRESVPPAPAGLLGTVRDEGLKRLLMSWYYAGYYTGYYEGRGDSQNRETTK